MKIKAAETSNELYQILEIQKENHYNNLTEITSNNKGFVTVQHSLELLEQLNAKTPQIIAKDNDLVVGYALAMLKEFKDLVPVLVPMFITFEAIQYKGKKLNDSNFYVMGQICVRDNYKRKGLFSKLYLKHKELYSKTFDYCITEVSSSNKPSMLAHQKVGFKTIHTFKDTTDDWNILLWDWR